MNSYEPTSPKARLLLQALLNGREMSVIDTVMEFNLMTPNARVSEMRKAGWPIKSLKNPHPNLMTEKITVYYMDIKFRQWWAENGHSAVPSDFGNAEGRGKFKEVHNG